PAVKRLTSSCSLICPSERAMTAMSLFAALDRVPDSRQPGGKRHRLQSVLALAVCGMLRGCKGLYAIAPWGRDHAGDVAGWLGFGRHGTPCVATLHHVEGLRRG